MSAYTVQRFLSPTQLGLNAVDLDTTTSAIDVEGFNQLCLQLAIDYVAATALTLQVQTSDKDASTWHTVVKVSGDGETVTVQTYSIAVSAADISVTLPIPLNYKKIRLVFAGANDTSDTLTVSGILGNV